MPGRAGRAPRVAVGAPGYLSVRAASEQLGLRPRSVRSLIERGRITSQRLGRIHFISQAQVDQYRRVRRARAVSAALPRLKPRPRPESGSFQARVVCIQDPVWIN